MKNKTADIQQIPENKLLDVSLTEQIYLRRAWEVDGVVHEEEAHEPLPEDIVSKLEELTGDMKGRVTVGAELASSIEFGFKAGAFCSIGVSCDSSEDAMEETHGVIFPLAERLVTADHEVMSKIRDSMLPSVKQLGSACPKVRDFEGEDETPARPKRSKNKAGKKSRFRSR